MGNRIVVIDGHPDAGSARFVHALAGAYAQAAAGAGRTVRRLTVAETEFPILRSAQDWTEGEPVAAIRAAQQAIRWADHLVIIYPLWLGTMPALLKAFLEQTFRAGFAVPASAADGRWPKGLLTGKSARIVVTMGMPALIYRWFYFAHSLRSLERNILRLSGIGPVHETLIGGIGTMDTTKRERWLERLRTLGRDGG